MSKLSETDEINKKLKALENLKTKYNTPGYIISPNDYEELGKDFVENIISKKSGPPVGRLIQPVKYNKPYGYTDENLSGDWMKGKNLKGVVQDINKFTGTPDTRMSYSQFSQDFPVYEKPAAVQNVELKKKPAGTKTTTGSSKPKKDWSKYEIKE